jgi:hypothetical protein
MLTAIRNLLRRYSAARGVRARYSKYTTQLESAASGLTQATQSIIHYRVDGARDYVIFYRGGFEGTIIARVRFPEQIGADSKVVIALEKIALRWIMQMRLGCDQQRCEVVELSALV